MSDIHPTSERLNAYLLDELDAATRHDVKAHLQNCTACREMIDKLQIALTAYGEAELGAANEVALGRLLVARPAVREPARRWATFAVAAAAASVIFMGGFWTGQRGAAHPAMAESPPAPVAAPESIRHEIDSDPPAVTFAVADSDLLGGLARRDTTWN